MTHILSLSSSLVLFIVGSSASLPPRTSSLATAQTTEPTVLPTPWKPWFVRKNASEVCILAKFGAEFVMKTSRVSTFAMNPSNALVSNQSHCGHDSQVLSLVFNHDWTLNFNFARDQSSIFVSEIVLNIGDKESAIYSNKSFETPIDFDYKCLRRQTIQMSDTINMTLMNVRFEAFKRENFNASEDDSEQWERVGLKCPLDRVAGDAWKITGISVGCGIFVLTFITLVAVWSGRRQEKVMLKVKLMRQWTLEEIKALEARNMEVNKRKANNKSGPKQSTNNGSAAQTGNSIANPTYGDPQSEKF